MTNYDELMQRLRVWSLDERRGDGMLLVRTADAITKLRAERDALWKERDYAIEQHDKIIKERDALRALLDRVLSCTDLHGWNGATAELLCADIDAALAEGKP